MSDVANWVDQFNIRQQHSRELWVAIKADFDRQSPPMTVRQVFYRMSAIGAVAKIESGYRQVQHALTVMREKARSPTDTLPITRGGYASPTVIAGLGKC